MTLPNITHNKNTIFPFMKFFFLPEININYWCYMLTESTDNNACSNRRLIIELWTLSNHSHLLSTVYCNFLIYNFPWCDMGLDFTQTDNNNNGIDWYSKSFLSRRLFSLSFLLYVYVKSNDPQGQAILTLRQYLEQVW